MSTPTKKRTKEQIAEDLSKILSLDLHYATKHSVLHGGVWAWTEYNGKIEGCEYWSRAAVESRHDRRNLTHEHLVPRNILIRHLLNLKNPTKGDVLDVLSRYCVGVVVTREEDKRLNGMGLRSKMPQGWIFGGDPWARYERCGLLDTIVKGPGKRRAERRKSLLPEHTTR